MSAIILLPVILPVATAAWPAVAAAAAAAASALGFAATRTATKAQAQIQVDLPVAGSEAVTQNLSLGQELAFTREDLRVTIGRDVRGQVSLRVCGGAQRSREELQRVGQELVGKLVQQYAYHQIVTELKQRNFNVVGQEVAEDGTVRLQVRTFQG